MPAYLPTKADGVLFQIVFGATNSTLDFPAVGKRGQGHGETWFYVVLLFQQLSQDPSHNLRTLSRVACYYVQSSKNSRLLLFLRSNSPNTFKHEFGLYVIVQFVVVREYLLE